MGQLHPFESIGYGGMFTVAIGTVMVLSPNLNPMWIVFGGLLVFFFGSYFWGAEQQKRKVESECELMNDYQASLVDSEIPKICNECENVDSCGSHDPHAGCETEAIISKYKVQFSGQECVQ